MNWAKIGLFAAGVLFGTAGIKVLGSKDAKKVYTETTAAALRAKECVMTTVTTIKENANDILTDAKEINEQRATDAAAEVLGDVYKRQGHRRCSLRMHGRSCFRGRIHRSLIAGLSRV